MSTLAAITPKDAGSQSLPGISQGSRTPQCNPWISATPITLDESTFASGPTLQPLVKLSFFIGSLLIVCPLFLRMADFFDNSAAFTFIAFGIILVIIAESNRVQVEDQQLFG